MRLVKSLLKNEQLLSPLKSLIEEAGTGKDCRTSHLNSRVQHGSVEGDLMLMKTFWFHNVSFPNTVRLMPANRRDLYRDIISWPCLLPVVHDCKGARDTGSVKVPKALFWNSTRLFDYIQERIGDAGKKGLLFGRGT